MTNLTSTRVFIPGAPAGHGSGPMWVKRRHRGKFKPCQLYPRKRTLELSREMSAMCQKQTLPQRRHAKRHLDE
jgi:hypothetical protein